MCGDFQVSGTDVRLVRWQLDGSPPVYQECALSLEPDRETSMKRRGRPASVRNIILVSGTGGVTLWGRDLGFVGGNVQEVGGGARVFLQTGDGSEVQAAERRYLEKRISGKGPQGSENSDTGDVY